MPISHLCDSSSGSTCADGPWRGEWRRETWHRDAIKIVGTDIARLANAAPYCKGGHRETRFSVRVHAHYKFMFAAGSIMWAAHPIKVFSSISFCFSYSYTCCRLKLASSLVNVSAHYKNTHITMVISARQTGHPPSITGTRIAHALQNRACPHGTSAKPARGATRHNLQQSSEVVAAATVADSDAPEFIAASTGACLSSSSSSLLLLLLLFSSSRGCRDSAWAPTEWLTARRNCR